jgi:hypothetical protein
VRAIYIEKKKGGHFRTGPGKERVRLIFQQNRRIDGV